MFVVVLGRRVEPAGGCRAAPVCTAAVVVVVVLIPLSSLIEWRLLRRRPRRAASGRVPLIEISLNMIRDHPLFGLGAHFIVALPAADYTGPEFSSDWLNVVHNRYLLIWTEAGFGALVAFVLFLLTTMHNGWRARQQHGSRSCPERRSGWPQPSRASPCT